MSNEPILEVHQLTKVYRSGARALTFLDAVDLVVERGLISEAELDQRTHEYATGARNDDDH